MAVLLEGLPGVGKTFLPECLARAISAHLIFGQLHSWTDDQELFHGINVAAAVGGDVDSIRQDGLLALAAKKSQESMTILVLDEVDKTSERTESLLLDFLQSGRVPVGPGEHVVANRKNLLVFLTSNGQRSLGDAVLRRVRRITIDPLPTEILEEVLVEKTGASKGLIRIVRKATYMVAAAEDAIPSIQEIENMILDLLEAEELSEIPEILAQWAARGPAGRELALSRNSKLSIPAIWSELKRRK